MRALYDDYEDADGEDATSPFTLEGAEGICGWVQAEAPDAPAGLNRMLAKVYERRPDLRAAYPDFAADLRGLQALGRTEFGTRERGHCDPRGRRDREREAQIDRARRARRWEENLARRADRVEKASAALHESPDGVNLIADFQSDLAVSEVARQVIGMLDSGGVPALPVQSLTAASRPRTSSRRDSAGRRVSP